jgi:hypothetical protein
MITARYGMSLYITQIRFALKRLTHKVRCKFWKEFLAGQSATGINYSTAGNNSFYKSLQYFSYLYQRPSGLR